MAEKGMKVVYMAHPVAGNVDDNLIKARAWFKWIEDKYTNVVVVANWILECELFGDEDPKARERGIRRSCAVLERCDELWLVGPHISKGMAEERDRAAAKEMRIRDLTLLGLDWPPGQDAVAKLLGCMRDGE